MAVLFISSLWLLLTWHFTPAFGQDLKETGEICGKVTTKEGEVMQDVLVIVVKSSDHSIGTQVLTDDQGSFCINGLTPGGYIVSVKSLTGLSASKKVVLFKGTQLTVDFTIMEDAKLLQEIVVEDTGIDVRGDTVIYTVGRFADGREKNLKELIKKLPQISINESTGTITAQGKQVSRVLLENSDLFQGNVSTPLNNLSPELVNQVEVIDNYSEYSIFDGFRTTGETVLNLKVRDGMKGHLTGQIDTSAGVVNRYGLKNSSIYIGNKTMYSAILALNNIGAKLLSVRDVIGLNGGFNSILSGDDPMEQMNNLLSTYAPFMETGKDYSGRHNGLLSLGVVIQPTPTTKLSLSGIGGLDNFDRKENYSYTYFSGLSYDEAMKERAKRGQMLLSLKGDYTPSKRFNILYEGNFSYLSEKRQSDRIPLDLTIHLDRRPKVISSGHSLIFAGKVQEKDNLVLALRYNLLDSYRSLSFQSEQAVYPSPFNLGNAYLYDRRERADKLSLELFYLHRVNDDYYIRTGYSFARDAFGFEAWMDDQLPEKRFDTSARTTYLNHRLDLRWGKDVGTLTYTIGGKLQYETIEARGLSGKLTIPDYKLYASPFLKLKWMINMSNHIAFDYDYGLRRLPFIDLVPSCGILDYNSFEKRGVEELYNHRHKGSITYLLSLPYYGFNFISLASLELYDKSVSNDLQIFGLNRISTKRVMDGAKTFSWINTAEYRVLGFPLNIRLSDQYIASRIPSMYDGIAFPTLLQNLNTELVLSTFFKKGFNGKLSAEYGLSTIQEAPSESQMTRVAYSGEVSWHNDRWSLSAGAGSEHYIAANYQTAQLSIQFDAEYNFSKDWVFFMTASNFLNLKHRVHNLYILEQYFSARRMIEQMPGHILFGVRFKY